MESIPHGALQVAVEPALQMAQLPAAGALQERRCARGQQGEHEGQGRLAPHHQHPGAIQHQREQGLQGAQALVEGQYAAADIGHQEAQQGAAAHLLKLLAGACTTWLRSCWRSRSVKPERRRSWPMAIQAWSRPRKSISPTSRASPC